MDIVVGRVVREDRRTQLGRVGKIPAVRTQVTGGGKGRIVDVVGVPVPVSVAVPAGACPGGGDELHRPDSVIEGGVLVEPPAVGIGDPCPPRRTVQPRADDRVNHSARGVDAPPPRMARLDLADRRQ